MKWGFGRTRRLVVEALATTGSLAASLRVARDHGVITVAVHRRLRELLDQGDRAHAFLAALSDLVDTTPSDLQVLNEKRLDPFFETLWSRAVQRLPIENAIRAKYLGCVANGMSRLLTTDARLQFLPHCVPTVPSTGLGCLETPVRICCLLGKYLPYVALTVFVMFHSTLVRRCPGFSSGDLCALLFAGHLVTDLQVDGHGACSVYCMLLSLNPTECWDVVKRSLALESLHSAPVPVSHESLVAVVLSHTVGILSLCCLPFGVVRSLGMDRKPCGCVVFRDTTFQS